MPEPKFHTDVYEAYSYLPASQNHRQLIYAEGSWRTCVEAAIAAIMRIHTAMQERNAVGYKLRGEEAWKAVEEFTHRLDAEPRTYWTVAYGTTFGVRRKMVDD